MITRLSESLLLEPCDVQPSQSGWEVIGVFNPAVALLGDTKFMLARVAERPIEKRPGWTALPRWDWASWDRARWNQNRKVVVDWVRDEDLSKTDARVVELKDSGNLRLTSVSHFQIFRQSSSSNEAWEFVDELLPEGRLEEYGIEDPRITKIDDLFWITYVAVSKSGAATALMSSTDLVTFNRHGIIFPSENKDVVIFPERIAGDFVALHRPNPRSKFHPPQIWIARSPDLIHWGRHEPILSGVQTWEADRVGSGTPPVAIDEGWLTLYHGSASSKIIGTVGRYVSGALLLDRNDPSRVIARSSEPIMLPKTSYETNGFVPDVVFPTAILSDKDDWQVFYGAADTSVAMALFSKQSVVDSLALGAGLTAKGSDPLRSSQGPFPVSDRF